MISPGGTRLPSGGSKMVPVPLRFRQTTRNIGSLINFFSNQLEEHRNDRASARFHFMKYPILPIRRAFPAWLDWRLSATRDATVLFGIGIAVFALALFFYLPPHLL